MSSERSSRVAPPTRVLVFDIDGTLTATNRVDGHYFRAAVRAVLPIPADDPVSGFDEHTDSAIFADLHRAYPTGDYNQAEAAVQRHFFEALRAATASDPEAFLPIPGAQRVFGEARRAGWLPAMATGGWRASAEMKLEAAGIPARGMPLASSSEYTRRVDIIRHAARLAGGDARSTEVVYVGDGPWDVRACLELGIGFIGREGPASDSSLRDLGARATVRDFRDVEPLLALLDDPADLVPEKNDGLSDALRLGW